jgi:glutamate-1-semialdehyde 2,1-aminomutase
MLLNEKDSALRARAARVVPGGMWGHQNAAGLPEGYPQFFESAEGCRIRDVNGREYVDFMCSWGPIIVGHRHPAVERAARAQAERGDCQNGPGEAMVELAELLVATIAHADWVQFAKNGTDATTTCATLARAATGRRKLLVAKGSYHGAVPWCSPSLVGVTSEDRAHIIQYDYNDAESLESAAAQAGDDLAGVLVAALRHDFGRAQELPEPEFARRLRALCDASGAALILDDVRAGFRLHSGGSWEGIGIRPDLSAWSKAIANGYPLAAVAGTDRFRDAATKLYATGSFWTAAVPMAAGIATIRTLLDEDGIATMVSSGQMLRDGLSRLAQRHGIAVHHSGPVQMPLMQFDGDADFALGNAFCSAALAAGAYFHPKHNMFLSAAHGRKDIELALQAADAGFAAVARRG